MRTELTILIISIILLVNCQSENQYTYKEIEAEVAPYLKTNLFDNFEQSDTLVVYDTTFFKQMSITLRSYQDKLVAKDSAYNNAISDRLYLIEEQKVQHNQPNIYLPFDAMMKSFRQKKEHKKTMIWLSNFPKQVEAAKMQLEMPKISYTQEAIEELKSAYGFVTNELKNHLAKTKQLKKHEQTLENVKFAIKDYLAFLNSKILNEEVHQ